MKNTINEDIHNFEPDKEEIGENNHTEDDGFDKENIEEKNPTIFVQESNI